MEGKIIISWRKSSYSQNGGECVEVADASTAVLVRDTANRDGGTLTFSAEAWKTFTVTLR
jgi:Domain of unknown function (DUF397)